MNHPDADRAATSVAFLHDVYCGEDRPEWLPPGVSLGFTGGHWNFLNSIQVDESFYVSWRPIDPTDFYTYLITGTITKRAWDWKRFRYVTTEYYDRIRLERHDRTDKWTEIADRLERAIEEYHAHRARVLEEAFA